MHAVGEYLEEAIQDLVPLFGIDLLCETHRPLHVGEKHRHLLPLTFQRASRREDLLGEVLRGIRPGIGRLSAVCHFDEGIATRVAELSPLRIRCAALRAYERIGERRGTFAAKFRALAVLAATARALHSD